MTSRNDRSLAKAVQGRAQPARHKCVQYKQHYQTLGEMGQLTTHVLDTTAGLPAAGVRIELLELTSVAPKLLASATTGSDGRSPGALIAGADFRAGRYALTFYVAEYFRGRGLDLPAPAFIEEVVVRIGIAQPDQHYHVPLLVSPWSYSVYRGG
jgi:hydroxyisourate hydrolase